MKIEINGRPEEVAAATLAALLDERGFDPHSVATALNGEFVARDRRAAVALEPGDRIEVLSPMAGG